MAQTAIIIGAGLGGLATAIRLARDGWKVKVLEKTTAVGGRLHCHVEQGYLWDVGPLLLTIPFVLRELFKHAGHDLEDYLELVPLDPVCRHFFPDGKVLNTWANPHLFQIEIARREKDRGESLERFARHTQGIHDLLAELGLFYPPARAWEWLQWRILKNLVHVPKVFSMSSMADTVTHFFKDPQIRQLFMRYALEKGAAPDGLPSAFSALSWFENQGGGWYIRGGMYRLAEALEHCAKDLGVEFLLDAEVQEIALEQRGLFRNPRATGVVIRSGLRMEADVVICNADAAHARARLLPSRHPAAVTRKLNRRPFSSAPFIILLGVKRRYDQLAHHNIFFPADPVAEFHDIFRLKRPASDPTIHLTISARSDATQAPEGHDNYSIMVHAPALEPDHHWDQQRDEYRALILRRLETLGLTGLEREITCEKVITPADFAVRTNAYRGALYGQADHGIINLLGTSSHRSLRVSRLYSVGQSLHPCDAIASALLSARRVGELVAGDLGRDDEPRTETAPAVEE